MKRFRIELDTRLLTVAQEDELIDALENVPCGSGEWWDEFYEGEFTVMPEQLPECIKSDDEDWVYGKIIVEGEVTRDVLGDIYEIFEGEVPYTDNDPFGIRTHQAYMDLIKSTVENPAKGALLMEKSREIMKGRVYCGG